MTILHVSGFSIPAIHFSVILFPHPEAPSNAKISSPAQKEVSRLNFPIFFLILTSIAIFLSYHRCTFFRFFPAIIFMAAITPKAMIIMMITQMPAVT